MCVFICTQVNEQLANRIKDFSKVLARMEMDKKYVVVVCLNVNVIFGHIYCLKDTVEKVQASWWKRKPPAQHRHAPADCQLIGSSWRQCAWAGASSTQG